MPKKKSPTDPERKTYQQIQKEGGSSMNQKVKERRKGPDSQVQPPAPPGEGSPVSQEGSLETLAPEDPNEAVAVPLEETAVEAVSKEELEVGEPTPEDEPVAPVDLSFKQSQAIFYLTSGRGIAETAELVGVNASTIHRWRKNNFKFEAALNANKRRVLDGAQSILVATSLSAAEVVSEEIRLRRNPNVALRVLERLGALAPPEIVSDDHITIGLDTVRNDWIKTIGEGSLGALRELFRTIEGLQGAERIAAEKLIESGLEPEKEDDDDEAS